MPKIAVLMAVYNGMEWLSPQLDSILRQQDVDVQVFASDDLSTDGSFGYLIEQSKREKRISILPHQGKFNSAGANFLRLLRDVDVSAYDFIAFSDQDDIWLEEKLSSAINLIKVTNVDGYSGNVTAFWPNGKQRLINKAQLQKTWDYMFESAGPGCSFVMSKQLTLDIKKLISEEQSSCKSVALHDWFVYAFARSRGYKWYIDKTPYVLYRQHTENVIGANVGLMAKFNRLQKFREGWLINQALLLAKILDYEDTWPIIKIRRYLFIDRLALILNIYKLRRRWRDCFALLILFLLPLK